MYLVLFRGEEGLEEEEGEERNLRWVAREPGLEESTRWGEEGGEEGRGWRDTAAGGEGAPVSTTKVRLFFFLPLRAVGDDRKEVVADSLEEGWWRRRGEAVAERRERTRRERRRCRMGLLVVLKMWVDFSAEKVSRASGGRREREGGRRKEEEEQNLASLNRSNHSIPHLGGAEHDVVRSQKCRLILS